MAKPKVPPEKAREAVVEIMAGTKGVREKARELGVSPATIHEKVVKAREATEQAAGGLTVTALGGGAAPVRTPLEVARGADPQLRPVKPTDAVTPEELARAAAKPQEDVERYCVDTIQGWKYLSGTAIAITRYKLSLLDPDLKPLLKLSDHAESQIRAAAHELYPHLKQVLGPWGGVIIALGFDTYNMAVGVHGLALKRGWTKGGRSAPPPPRPQAQEPAPAQLPAELPREVAQTLNAPRPGQGPRPAPAIPGVRQATKPPVVSITKTPEGGTTLNAPRAPRAS
jgi:hypothetical protein